MLKQSQGPKVDVDDKHTCFDTTVLPEPARLTHDTVYTHSSLLHTTEAPAMRYDFVEFVSCCHYQTHASSSELDTSWLPASIMQRACVQAAQQGDSTKVDKRRKKKQKEQAEEEAFLDNGQDEDAEYQQGASGKPVPPDLAHLMFAHAAHMERHSYFGSQLAASSQGSSHYGKNQSACASMLPGHMLQGASACV